MSLLAFTAETISMSSLPFYNLHRTCQRQSAKLKSTTKCGTCDIIIFATSICMRLVSAKLLCYVSKIHLCPVRIIQYLLYPQEQYIFIHDALVEGAICGHTHILATKLHRTIHEMSQITRSNSAQVSRDTGKTGYQEQFAVSCCSPYIAFPLHATTVHCHGN